jgi:histidinol-phosphate/aromatic aminotransferase/cobyric acid decarboxylase-like protein
MGFNDFISKLFGNKHDRDMREIQPWVEKAKKAYIAIEMLTADELRAKTKELQERIRLSATEENAKIIELKAKVDEERAAYRDMLLKRGKTFEAEAKRIGLGIVPFDAGFFVSIPMPNADAVAQELEKEGIFLVPLAKGLRVSVAAVSEEKAKILPRKIKDCMERLG